MFRNGDSLKHCLLAYAAIFTVAVGFGFSCELLPGWTVIPLLAAIIVIASKLIR